MVNSPNIMKICTTACLSYLLITVKAIELVISKILGLFVNTFTADDKYSTLSRDNLG